MGNVSHISLIVILFFLLFSPVISNISSGSGPFFIHAVIAYVSSIWMVVLFLFFSVNILIDFYKIVMHLSARLFSPGLLNCIPENRITFITILIFIAVINIYGWFEAGHLTIEKIKINTSKLPSHVKSLKVVQISDTHFSSINGVNLARKIVKKIKELNPDILISTGDLIDRGSNDRKDIAGLFDEIKTTYGKYATTGNHEFFAGIKEATEFTERAGFKMLRNETIEVTDFLSIGAIDDPAGGERFGNRSRVPEDKVIETFFPENLNIFLKHQPRIEKESIGHFDLQLSGHTHKGQIFPFTLIVAITYPYLDGFYSLGNGSNLYVSRGTGTWGPPIRFLTFPEITVIEFIREDIKTGI